jgi:secreted trypsin-like serine protease
MQPAEYTIAMLGKHNLSNYNENHSQNVSVREIILHPNWQWNVEIEESYNSDIAVVLLKENVVFSSHIQPVCLPQQSFLDVTESGIVVGWGKAKHSENPKKYTKLPSELEVPIINSTHCLTISQKLSNLTFCGSYKNEQKTLCTRDSGGGFHSLEVTTDLFEIRGIVSSTISNQQGQCDINAYQLFTNVARFTDWIEKVVKETKNVPQEFVVFKCFYTLVFDIFSMIFD